MWFISYLEYEAIFTITELANALNNEPTSGPVIRYDDIAVTFTSNTAMSNPRPRRRFRAAQFRFSL